MVLGLTFNSTHPVSRAITNYLHASGIEPLVIEHITSHPGKGIKAWWKGSLVRAGSPYWLDVQDHSSVINLLSCGLTVFCVIIDVILIAVYGLRDELPCLQYRRSVIAVSRYPYLAAITIPLSKPSQSSLVSRHQMSGLVARPSRNKLTLNLNRGHLLPEIASTTSSSSAATEQMTPPP